MKRMWRRLFGVSEEVVGDSASQQVIVEVDSSVIFVSLFADNTSLASDESLADESTSSLDAKCTSATTMIIDNQDLEYNATAELPAFCDGIERHLDTLLKRRHGTNDAGLIDKYILLAAYVLLGRAKIPAEKFSQFEVLFAAILLAWNLLEESFVLPDVHLKNNLLVANFSFKEFLLVVGVVDVGGRIRGGQNQVN